MPAFSYLCSRKKQEAMYHNKPLVSVLIPNYNHGIYLRERIDSVLNQDYENFEVIILDDCSYDNSREIIAQYSGCEHVREIIFNGKNSGNTFIQWNRGVQKSLGKYIWIAESDDSAEPSFISTLVEQLENNPKAVLAYSYSKVIDQASHVIFEDNSASDKENMVKTYDGHRYIEYFMLSDNTIYNASMVIFRRDIYDKINPKYKLHRCCGDWLFWTCACEQGDVIEVRKPLNHFRQHWNKVTTKSMTDGSAYEDLGGMLTDMVKELHMSTNKMRSMRVRWHRRIMGNYNIEDKQSLIDRFPLIFKKHTLDYPAYKYYKIRGFMKARTRNILGLFNVPLKNVK